MIEVIDCKYANEAKPEKRYGSIVDVSGDRFVCPAALVPEFSPGMRYSVEIREETWNDGPVRIISRILPNKAADSTAPAVTSNDEMQLTPEEAFCDYAYEEYGLLLSPQDIKADGEIHRCRVEGRTDLSGAYKLHLDGIPAGWIYDHANGEDGKTWAYRNGEQLSGEELEERRRAAKARQEEIAAERERAAQEAEDRSRRRWDAAEPLAEHDYLTKKHVAAHDLRRERDEILVPMRDINGVLRGVQRIAPDGTKMFSKGGRINGLFHRIGAESTNDSTVVIAEGYATGASIHAATGDTVFVAFNKGNLIHVAKAARQRWPKAKITLAADDDHATEANKGTNPGLKCALAAARAVNGKIAVPGWGSAPRGEGENDFNDLANNAECGEAAIKLAFDTATKPDERLAKIILADPHRIYRKWLLEEYGALKGRDPEAYSRLRAELRKTKEVSVTELDKEVEKLLAAARAVEPETEPAPVITEQEDEQLYPHWDVKPWPEEVSLSSVLDGILARIKRHVIISEEGGVAITLWITLTWVHDRLTHSPILLITSAEANSGKSTALGVVSFLAHRTLLSVGISAAALFRSIEKWLPAFVIDEADTIFNKNEDLREVVNSGWTRGQGVVRCDEETKEPRLFSTFCPKALGMKGRKLPDTTLSRSVIVSMKRKLPSERAEDFEHVDDAGFQALRRKLARWANDHGDKIIGARPELPDGFINREAGNWRPLLAIADLAGDEWAARARKAARAISKSVDRASVGVQLLADVKAAFADKNTDRLSTKEIFQYLIALEDRNLGASGWQAN
jgi:putative DNA primase/helicase